MHATQSGQSYLEKNKVEDSYFPISKLKIKIGLSMLILVDKHILIDKTFRSME